MFAKVFTTFYLLQRNLYRQFAPLTGNDEGKFVADTIQEQKLRYHFRNKDFAILYRTNAQSRAFEESLRRMGIPYVIYGGISFYQRKEIKDFLAYLRLIVNPRDEEALKRIINYPARGIGKTTIDKCVLLANEKNISMWEVLLRARELGFRAGTADAIEEFVTMIRSFGTLLQKQNAYDVAVHVGKQTGIVKELFNDKSTEGLQRYENIQELLNSIKEWVDDTQNRQQIDEDGVMLEKANPLEPPTAQTQMNFEPQPTPEQRQLGAVSLGAYLQQITLLTDADEKDPDSDSVKLMTIHAAKGLEFECVFAAGLEEQLFPNAMSLNTREELEEERCCKQFVKFQQQVVKVHCPVFKAALYVRIINLGKGRAVGPHIFLLQVPVVFIFFGRNEAVFSG